MGKKTKGQIEAQISESLIKFEKEYMGRGPMETRTFIVQDMVLVRLKGVLTPAEEQLSKSEEGAKLIKQTRKQLLENGKALMEKMIMDITGCQVVSLHSDISTRTGERIILFVVDGDLEGQLSGN